MQKTDEMREHARLYYVANREKLLEQSRAKYIARREWHREWGKRYRAQNPEREKKRAKRYRQTPQGKESGMRAIHKRRARKLANHHAPYSKAELSQRFELFGQACAYCGSKSILTMDHFIPLSSGGSDCLGNLIPACKSCNSSKHNREAQAWYESQTFYSQGKWKAILRALGKVVDGQIPLL